MKFLACNLPFRISMPFRDGSLVTKDGMNHFEAKALCLCMILVGHRCHLPFRGSMAPSVYYGLSSFCGVSGVFCCLLPAIVTIMPVKAALAILGNGIPVCLALPTNSIFASAGHVFKSSLWQPLDHLSICNTHRHAKH